MGTSDEIWAIVQNLAKKGGRLYENEDGRIVITPPGLVDDDLRERMNKCRPQLEAWARKSLKELVEEEFKDRLIPDDQEETESAESTLSLSLPF